MKKILTIILTVFIMFQSSISINALSDQTIMVADALNYLGVFQGTDNGYALDKTLTRAEAVTMIVRLLGKEEYALSQQYEAPFGDVPTWAQPYVNYAYLHNITKGVSETEFQANTEISIAQFLTLVLRLLGYNDQVGEFQWDKPFELANRIGLINNPTENGVCYRSEMVMICWNALHCKMPLENQFLVSQLITDSVFSKDMFLYVYNDIMHTTMNHLVAEELGVDPNQNQEFPNPSLSYTEDSYKNPIGDENYNESKEETPPNNGIEDNQIHQPEDSMIGEGEIGEDW